MAIYKITDILNSIQSMRKDGYEYVDISELMPDEPYDEDDEDIGATLILNAIENDSYTEEDMIDSVKLPDNYSCHQ
ncbi:MAG: hypothetical protein HFI75_00705 [Lachnospiraceae bacterium]|nr:hypothetical protein [Lachnospiraceae bacterium]